MNLRTLAELDLETTLEDTTNGYGVTITVTDPDGNSAPIDGQSGDIHFSIDPDTGQAVSGRVAHVALRISSLSAGGLAGLPVGVNDNTGKPWVFTFSGADFIVREARPDRTLGLITIVLEVYG